MNKKTLVMVLLAVFLVSALAAGAEAAFKDALDTVFKSIENFFASGWKSYEKGLAFFLVFFLFFSSFLIGAKKAFGEISKPVIVFCFAAAAISGGILIVTNKFTLVQFGYVAFGLLFLMVTSAFYAMLMKVGLENHKFAAFFIAFFITGAIFFVGYLLSQKGGPLEFGGDIFGWLNDVTASFKGKGAGQDIAPAKGDFLPEGQAPKKIEKGWLATVTGPFEKRPVTSGLVMVVVLLIFALMGGRRISGWFKKKGGQEDEARRQQQLAGQEQPLTFDRLLEILRHYHQKKIEVKSQFETYKTKHADFSANFHSLKEEMAKKGGVAYFQKEFSPWLVGGEGDKGPEKSRWKFWEKIPQFDRDALEFIGHLREFAVVEHFLPIRAAQIDGFIRGARVSQEWITDVKEEIKKLQKISQAISTELKETYKIERQEQHIEEEILKQLKPEHQKERTSVQWLLKEGNLEEILGKLIKTEITGLEKMVRELEVEIEILANIINVLEKNAQKIKAAEQKTAADAHAISGTVTLPAEIADRTANISVPVNGGGERDSGGEGEEEAKGESGGKGPGLSIISMENIVRTISPQYFLKTLTQIGKLSYIQVVYLISLFPEERQSEILGRTKPDIANELRRKLNEGLEKDVKDKEKILNLFLAKAKELGVVETFGGIEKLTFDDLLKVAGEILKKTLQKVEPATIALALKIASEDLRNKILENVDEGKKEEIKDQHKLMGPKTLMEIEEAQRAIVGAVKKATGET